MTRPTLLAALAALLPLAAQGRPATCRVEVGGRAVIDGPCDFSALDPDGSFQVASPDGATFAQVNVAGPGLGDGYWNGDAGGTHAHEPLGRLARNDACWSNATATICAW